MLHGMFLIKRDLKYQLSNKKHENSVKTTENDSTLTPTTQQIHYLKSNTELAELRDCILLTSSLMVN